MIVKLKAMSEVMPKKLYQFIGYTLLLLSFVSLSNVVIAQAGQEAAIKHVVHTVTKGDYLEAIKRQYCNPDVSVADIARYNQIKRVDLLQPGQNIRIPVSMLKTQKAPIKVMVLSGDVQIKGKLGQYKALDSKDLLGEGDSVKAGAKSLAKFRFSDGSVVNLQPNSVMQIVQSRKLQYSDRFIVKVKLNKGRAEINANPEHLKNNQFEVKTPSAVAVVRGTTFRVSADHGLATEETLDGAVDFAVDGQAVLVKKDYGSAAKNGQPPLPPKALPAAPNVAHLKARFDYLPVAFDLQKQADATMYIAQVATDDTFSNLVLAQSVVMQTAQLSQLDLSTLEDGQYYLKLRAQDSDGLQSRDAIHPFEIDVYPLAPQFMPPVEGDGVTAVGKQLFWSAIDGANAYVVQVAADDSFADVIFEKKVLYTNLYLTEQVPSSAFWRVAAKTADNPLKFSTPIPIKK